MSTTAFPFSIPVGVYFGAATSAIEVRAYWQPNIASAQGNTYDLVVQYEDNGTYLAGLYVFTNNRWQMCIPYAAVNDFIISGGSVSVYVDITVTDTPEAGATVYRNGVEITATSLTPLPGVVWSTIFVNPTTGGGSGVSSFNSRTGAVTLTASDVTAVLPAATSSALGGVKIGSGVTVQADGTISVSGGYTLPAATAGALGGVKTGANVTIAGDGTISVAAPYTLPAATAGTLGGVIVGTGINVTGGTISVTPYTLPAATAGTLGGVIVGSGINVSAGTISVPTGAGYVLPAATTSTLGGVEVGSGLTITGSVLSANVQTVAGVSPTTGNVALAVGNITGAAPLASPTFTGTLTAAGVTITGGTQAAAITASGLITANGGITLGSTEAANLTAGTTTVATAAPGTTSTVAASTAFVATSFAPLASPTFTGVPAAPTATAGTSTTQLATTAFVGAAITAGGFLTTANAASTYAPLAAPALTGAVTINSGTTAIDALSITGGNSASGAAITLTNTAGTAGAKTIRSVSNVLQFVNAAHSTVLTTMDDSGNWVAGTTGSISAPTVTGTTSVTASGFNSISITPATTGNAPTIASVGGNVNVSLQINTQGSGGINLNAATAVTTGTFNSAGQIGTTTAGAGLTIKGGTNAKIGTVTLAAGAATVANTSVTASSVIFLTVQNGTTTTGTVSVGTITAGTSFTIVSSNTSDTTTVAYMIVEQG
jgi:hypothetical protein